LVWVEEITNVSERLKEGIECSCRNPAQVGFRFRERHFNRVEIRGIGRQKQEPAAAFSQRLCRAVALVGGKVVKNDHSSRVRHRCKLGLDISLERQSIYYRQVNACIHREALRQ